MTLFEISNFEIYIKPITDIGQLTNAIVSAGNALLQEAGRLFKPHGISAAQFNVLNLLADASGGLRPSDLTQALVVDPSSTTYVLDRMETLGWLRRADDHDDRRAWRIVLTPAGRKLHERVAPLYAAALQQTMRGLDATRLAPLADALGEIQHAAHAAVDSVLTTQPQKRRPTRRIKP